MPVLIRFHKTGGPEVLQYDNVPARALRSGEIRLKVEAIGLNRAEIMFRTGQYVETPEPPSLLGYEAAGVIEEVGPDVKGLKPGDRAASIPGFSMTHYGTYGDSVVLPAFVMVKTPDRLSSIEAAACWMQYCTAYMLVEFGGMKRGDSVLITAAASSVGLAAIQIANEVGARPIATTRNAGKVQALLDAGASAVINTKESDLVGQVRQLTNGKGANIIFDPVVGPQLEALCEAAAPSARIFLYGLLDPRPAPFPMIAALSKDLTIYAYRLSLITGNLERLQRVKTWILERLESGALKPAIARIFPFKQMVEAHRYMESSEQIGKIVVSVP
ncbi:MAG: Alcohol dehydrogenase zinc-binding domain protein [Pedosphaera sp.]|nr:Alcohol dehydrogenase zinc-binding domain protein [Pedosphaera sp.]